MMVPAGVDMEHHRTRELRCGCARAPADPSQGPRPFKLPGDPEHFGRDRPFALTHLSLDLTLDVERARLEGRAELAVIRRAPESRTLTLDAIAFEVRSVRRREGEALTDLAFSYDGEHIAVTLDADEAVVLVEYAVAPRRGLYFFRPDATSPTRPWQVWSQCQDEDARYWFPCVDAPIERHSTEVTARVPRGWRALSNGRLVEHRVESDADVWHWRQDEPHAPYLVTLVAGTFAELDATAEANGLDCRYYVDPGREEDARRTLGRTPAMIRHFETVTGVAFPWAKYHQVCVHDFVVGGMENTSATTLTERCLLDARAAIDVTMDDLVAHELAHQWFGDLVTCRDWSHAWLNEGFATFFEHVDLERREGRDAALYNLKEHADTYFTEDERYRRPIVCATWGSTMDLFDHHLYEKGGCVLHMLRAELGEAVFWRGVRRYLERHRGGVVETRDLVRAMEDASGRALGGFFDQWVMRGGYPDVEVEARYESDESSLSITVRQTQTVDAVTPLFRFKLRVIVVDADGERAYELDVRDATHAFHLRCPRAPRRVAVDPDGVVLMRLTQKLPRQWLLDALAHDARAVVRWRAANALRIRDDRRVVDALARAVEGDAFWGVCAEAAHALGEIRTEAAFEALRGLLSVKHPKARRAVVAALGGFRTDASATALSERLAAGDESCMVEAELARALGATRRHGAYEALVAALDRRAWRDVVRAGALDGMRSLRDPRALDHAMAFSARAHGVGVRRAALACLGELGENRATVREHLESLLDEDDPVVTPAVADALVKTRDPAVAGSLARAVELTHDGRVRRSLREALRAVRERSPGDEVRKVRDEVDRLRDEMRALRDEVAKLRVTPPRGVKSKARGAAEEGSGRGSKGSRKASSKVGAKRRRAPR